MFTDQDIDECLNKLDQIAQDIDMWDCGLPPPSEALREPIRAMLAKHTAAPAVPRGIPAQEVIDAIEAWKSAWLKVPPFADRVNKATREAITISHNSLFLLLQSAQQAQRMPAGCTTPTGCGPHGCHGACIASTPATPSQPVNRPQNCGTSFCSCIECVCEPSQPVTLTDDGARRVALSIIEDLEGRKGVLDDVDDDVKQEMLDSFAETIIAALGEKQGGV